MQWVRRMINLRLDSQKKPNISPSRVSYGVCIVSILENITAKYNSKALCICKWAHQASHSLCMLFIVYAWQAPVVSDCLCLQWSCQAYGMSKLSLSLDGIHMEHCHDKPELSQNRACHLVATVWTIILAPWLPCQITATPLKIWYP